MNDCTTNQTHSGITGIIAATVEEISNIKNAMENVTVSTITGLEFAQGTISGNPVVVVQSGMGKVNAGICAQTLITQFGAKRVINIGVAGALTPELTICDFVISTDAVQHDYDVSPIGFKRGEIPYTGMVAFPADEELRKKAVAAVKTAAPKAKVLEGRIASGDQFINQQAQKDTILQNFGGLCAEMEGAAMAQVCYLNETPFVIIRVISDDCDGMSFEEFLAIAGAQCANATIAMVSSL